VFDVTNFNRQTVKLERLSIDFKDFLIRLPAIARPRIHEKNLRLSTQLPDEKLNVRIDRGYFEKAVDNVIEYLADNSTAGSEILLSLTAVEDRYRPYADLRISGPGVTLNTEDVSQIFSPFYHPSEGNNHDTGLRLTIAKEIIELHDGEIDASQTPEAGLSFSIKLPLVRVKEAGTKA
jgi:signal transduction histidine kinase